MAMKATDLMIGNWVYDTMRQENKKVTRMDFERNPMNGVYYAETLKPIPLTSDILVKYGFEKQGDLYQYHINAGDGYTKIDIIDLQDGVWSYDIDVYDEFTDSHKIHHDDYCFLKLHQLQHLMRLSGIDKELTI